MTFETRDADVIKTHVDSILHLSTPASSRSINTARNMKSSSYDSTHEKGQATMPAVRGDLRNLDMASTWIGARFALEEDTPTKQEALSIFWVDWGLRNAEFSILEYD